jgi:hypothetical protein
LNGDYRDADRGRHLIFISFRSSDTGSYAAVCLDELLPRVFGSENVFRSSRSIRPGAVFQSVIDDALRRTRILLALIGKDWLTCTDRDGRRLIDRPDDWVRREIAESLRAGVMVIPVLLTDARLPARTQIPAEIADLADRQAVHLRHRHMDPDVQYLIRQIRLLAPDLAQGGGPVPQPSSAMASLPYQPTICTLPADTAVFAGREQELARICEAATDAAKAGRVVAIHAIAGMPGVGKTTLATHVGHRLSAEFPDGQFFIDLHAHTPGREPLDPREALATLLADDGVDPRGVPSGQDQRAAMWRTRMAGRRMLLILDNSASSEQVIPLLPGATGCLVLTTSRRYLGDLPSVQLSVELDTLPPKDAVAMFLGLAPRAAAEPGLVAAMVDLCGHLPLAISLLASLYNRHRSWTMADLVAETEAKLLVVKAENRTVAAAFDLSYRYLTGPQQDFFRYLGLHPGPDIDPHAAAALTGLPLPEATTMLDELHGDGLIAEPAPRRYRMHNLIHEYARSIAAADGGR